MDFEARKIGGNGHVAIHDWSPVDEKGQHKSSNEIQNEIEETRHTMDTILDALEGRANPRTIIDRFLDTFQKSENKQKVMDTLGTIGNSLSRSFQRNPLPFLMVTAGSAWMIYDNQRAANQPQYYRGEQETATEGMKQKAQGAAGQGKEKLGQAKEQLQQKAGQAEEKLKGTASSARETASDISGRAKETLRSGAEKTDSLIHENPLVTGAIALVAGLLAGALTPETKKEKEVMGEPAKDIMDQAKETGQGVSEGVSKGLNEGQSEPVPPTNELLNPRETDTNPLDISQEQIEKQKRISEGEEPNKLM